MADLKRRELDLKERSIQLREAFLEEEEKEEGKRSDIFIAQRNLTYGLIVSFPALQTVLIQKLSFLAR